MARFLIEVPHSAEKSECERVVRIFLNTGSHFLTNADWGCYDGEHKAWVILESENKEEARFVLPPAFRPQAKIVQLDKFALDKVDEIYKQHQV